MNKRSFRVFSLFTILALMLAALPMQSVQAAPSFFANPSTTVFINEIHYDNASTDAGEAIEVAGPAGTDLAGWSLVLYNGSGGAVYGTIPLSGVITNQQGGYGTLSFAFAGIQNGAPDGIALVNGSTLVQFLSYEGTFAGVGGAANGIGSTDIGVSQNGTEPLGSSLQLTGSGDNYGDFTWNATTANTFGNPNTGQTFAAADVAPTVSSTTPVNGATNVAINTNIDVTFSEAVNVSGAWFSISCGTSSSHTATVSGGPTTFTLNPDSDFVNSESCTVTIVGAQVTDQDANDPPDEMAADFNFSFTTAAPVVSAVIINELDSDTSGTDALEFVELYDGGAGNTDLTGLVVVFYNGSNDLSYAAFDLDGFSTNASGYFLLGNAGVSPAPGIIFADNFLQNGADAVALYGANGTDFPNSTPVSTSNLIDAIVYGTADVDDAGLLALLNASEPQVNEDTGGNSAINSNQRCPNGSGGARNTSTYAQFNPSAGVANNCANDSAPSVTSTNPTSGAANVAVTSSIDVTFSEAVNAGSSSFTISCSASGPHTAALSGGPTTFTLNPDIDFMTAETCTVTVLAAQVTDQDTNDPPDNMAADFGFSFSTEGPVCDQTFTPIYSIQGSGTSAAITGTVTTKGVVVGDFEGSASASGFYIQDLTGDGDAATSDGIFVYTGSSNLASVGDVVRVTGFARERFSQTALNGSDSNGAAVTNVVNCGSGSVPVTDVTLPFASSTFAERYEGMYVRLPQALVIAEYFNYDRFGEMVLALPLPGETRPFTGTAIDEPGVGPGSPANLRTAANALSRITLDDAQSAQNPIALRHPNGATFTLANRFRGGDTVQNTVGVLGFDFSLYRIFPTGPADYTSVNPRPASPDPVGGTIRVAAMNTLNFFVTLDTTPSDSGPGPCGANQNLDCRGADADQPNEFTRQRDKLLTALLGLDADIIGLNELESTPGAEPMDSIVAGMPGYAYIDTGPIGTDAIKVGLIYRSAVVTPVGSYQLLTSAVDPRFIDTKSRPSLAQTFEVIATGARFTVVVNHFKSKGSACTDVGDPDLLDGQGNCSQTRRAAAEALVDWLATDPTGSGDPDFLIVGDLNSYAMEDTIDEIKAGSDDTVGTSDDFTNLISYFEGPFAYSYTFDGQAGYLDHSLANVSMLSQVTGATEWHINSDEPDILDYDTTFKPAEQEALYEVNPYRTSDHDAVVVGLDPTETIPPDTTIDSTPSNPSNSSSASFTFSGTDNATPPGSLTFECDLDGGGFAACTSPQNYTGLSDGSHTFQVRSIDGDGNVDPTPASFTWAIDTAAPTISVTAGGMCASSGGTLNLTVADTSGNPLTLSGSSSNTTAVPNANIVFAGSGSDRTVTITALSGSTVRTAVVTVTVSDGLNTASTTITVIVGTSGNNTALNGTSGSDLILGLSGNDKLNGLAGNDLLCAGSGNDTVEGGDNEDTLDGDFGNDVLHGGNGDDSITGGSGNDVLSGDAGNDSLSGGTGNDTLTGGADADFFSGGSGNDKNTDFNAGQGDTNDGT